MTVLGVVWLYAFVTDHRPPVLRASVLVTIVFIGSSLTRVVSGINGLAVAAIALAGTDGTIETVFGEEPPL